MYGSDASCATELPDFENFVRDLRVAWQIRDNFVSKNTGDYLDMKNTFEKKIVSKHNICKGQSIEAIDVACKKTSQKGIPASDYLSLMGKIAIRDIGKDEVIDVGMFE
jgi:sialic acid synthase SpsE